MNCNQVQKNIIGYIDHSIPEVLSADIEKHIGSCQSCAMLYKNISDTYNSYGKVSEIEVNPFFYTRMEQKLKNRMSPETVVEPKLSLRLQPVISGVLIVCGISLGIFLGKNLSVKTIAQNKVNRTELVNTYASEFYLTGTSEESLNTFFTNE